MAVLRKSSTASTKLARTDMEGTEITTTSFPASKAALAMRLTQMARVTMGLSLSSSASSNQGRLGLGPSASGTVLGEGASSSLSSSVRCKRGSVSDERKISLGVRLCWGSAVPEPLGVVVP